MNDQELVEDQKPSAIKYGWVRAVLFLITALIATAIFSFAGMVVISIIFGTDFTTLVTDSRNIIKDLGLPAKILLSLFGFMGMLLTAYIFRKFIDRKSFSSLGFAFSTFKGDFVFGLVLGFVLISLGFGSLHVFGMISIENIGVDFLLLTGYLLVFMIGSFNEEIMIRGYVLSNFCDSINRYIALFISSLIFALLHLGNANVTVLSFINILLAGVLLGVYYIHKRNLWLPIGLHFSWNFFQGPVYGFEVSGVDITGVFVLNVSGNELWTGGSFGFEGSLIATILMVLSIALLEIRYRKK